MLDAVWSAPLRKLDPVADTRGDAYALRNGAVDPAGSSEREREDAAGAVLLLDGALAHLAVGAAPAVRDDTGSGDRRGAEAGRAGPASGIDPASRPPSSAASISSPILITPAQTTPRSGGSPAGTGQGSDGANEQPRVDLETMRGIYGRARDLAPDGPTAPDRVQGYRLVRVLDRNISWVDIRITGDGYAVLGSHDRCDLVLSSDAGVWLRHMAAICVRLPDDSVGLRLIDLKTDLPFFLDDDMPRWSVLARGSFAMRLGRHVVCGFPIGAAAAEPAGVPAPARADGGARAPAAERGDQGRGKDLFATGVLETGISFNMPASVRVAPSPPPVELATFLPSAPVSQIQDLLGPSVSGNRVRVTLERGGMGASVELPVEALEAGVLLGRALNCFDGGLRRIFCEAISRAHVLLFHDRDDVFAFDLCSTNGTRVGGQRIRRHRLSDGGTTLELGKKVVFRWHRRE